MDEKNRKLILARRARFVAAALAGVAATTTLATTNEACSGGGDSVDGGSEADPKPCLKVAPGEEPTGSGTGSDPGNPTDGGGGTPTKDGSISKFDAEPQPCLFAPIDPDR
jgi:hypothetical protein